MKLKKINGVAIFLAAMLACFGCNDKIPVKEMALARYEISQALSVKADKYAPDELNEAKKKLLESHELVKTDKLEDSQKAAVDAFKKAREAYDKALPLLAKDTIDGADKSIEAADEAYARVLAENEFTKAGNTQVKANELFEQKKYYRSYETALEADAQAIEAKNIAISKKHLLAEAIAEVKSTLEDANKYNAPKYAPEKYASAEENVKTGETALDALLLKKGFAAVEVAKMEADEAYRLSLEGTSRSKAEEAKSLFAQAEASEGAAIAKDELNAAREAMIISGSLLDEGKFKESISASNESMRLSNLVLNSLSASAEKKIAGAEALLLKAKESEGAAIAVKELTGAAASLALSKKLLSEKKYKDAIAAAEESERLSNIVLNARKGSAVVKDVKQGGTEVTKGDEDKDYIIYKVRYIPERRDCLWRIAEKFYKEPLYWKKIYEVNTNLIKDPDLILPDQMLKIPKLDKLKTTE